MNDETYELYVKEVQRALIELAKFKVGTKEWLDVMDRIRYLIEMLNESDKNSAEWFDKQERRRIEEEKNNSMIDVEKSKQTITWKKASLELSKVVIPLLISIAAYNAFQKRICFFEEHGSIVSKAGRELHLPSFITKWF